MVIDTSAVFAIEFGEAERETFGDAIKGAARRLMSSATAVESISVYVGRRPHVDARATLDDQLREFAIEIVPVDDDQWRAAADALIRFGKGRHPACLNLADSFAYALAKVTGEPLLFKGADFALTDIASAV